MMSNLADMGKYIQRLVRVISEKEKIIDHLKKEAKDRIGGQEEGQKNCNSITEVRLRKELDEVHEEVRSLVQKMNKMEGHIVQLTLGLQEEMTMNESLQRQLEQYRNLEEQLRRSLEETILSKQTDQKELSLVYQKEQDKVDCLEEQKNKLQQQLSAVSNELNQTKTSLTLSRLEHEQLRQIIDDIFKLTNKELFQTRQSSVQKIMFQKIETMEKLKKIQSFVAELMDNGSDVLDQTLQGISIIMHSFEQKLEEVHCLTERNNLKEDIGNKLKESVRSVPPFSQKKTQIKIKNFFKENDPLVELCPPDFLIF